MESLAKLSIVGGAKKDLDSELRSIEAEIDVLIASALEEGASWSAIGNVLGKRRSTIHREFHRRQSK